MFILSYQSSTVTLALLLGAPFAFWELHFHKMKGRETADHRMIFKTTDNNTGLRASLYQL
jgi:hypothetical protein